MDEIPIDGTAAMLGCSAQWVRRLCRDEVLHGRKVGRSWLVDRGSVTDLLHAWRSG